MTKVDRCITALMKRCVADWKPSWLQKYWLLKLHSIRSETSLSIHWLEMMQRCTLTTEYWFAYRTWGYAEPLGRFAVMYLLFLGWTWRNVETLHWSKGMEREKSDKMCGSNTGRWSISVIMILPDCKEICSPVNSNDGARPMWAE